MTDLEHLRYIRRCDRIRVDLRKRIEDVESGVEVLKGRNDAGNRIEDQVMSGQLLEQS